MDHVISATSQRLRVQVYLDDTLVTDIDTQVLRAVVNQQNDTMETGENPTSHTYRLTGAKTLIIDWQERT